MKKGILVLAILTLLISGACSGAKSTQAPAEQQPVVFATGSVMKQKIVLKPGETIEIVTPTPTPSTQNTPLYESIAIDKAEIISTGNPPRPTIRLVGSLPTECHKLVVKIGEVDKNNNIFIKALSNVQLPNHCTQQRAPFDHQIVIEGLKPGKYTIWVSQGKIGEITIS